MSKWWLSLSVLVILVACAPSDPSPPLRLSQTAGSTVVTLDKNEAPNARLILLEVIPNPSKVLSESDERSWQVAGNADTAVDEVALGRTPPGWEERVPWRPPNPGSRVTVRVELTDGRTFLIDAKYP